MVTVSEVLKARENFNIDYYESLIDVEIRKSVMSKDWIDVFIDEEMHVAIRNKLAKKYCAEGGWGYVLHRTSSENGERGGLTHFMFFTKDKLPDELWKSFTKENYHYVTSKVTITKGGSEK